MPHTQQEIPWYVVYTKLNKELQVVSLLEEKGLTVFLPEVYQTYRGKVQLRPLFPRYLFVQMDLDELEIDVVNFTPGVVKVVSNEDIPLPLRDDVIQAIRAEVERLNAVGGLPAVHYDEGEMVQLRTGPLAGMEAVFIKHLPARDRVIVLLKFLGQENKIEIDISEIEPKRRRGTRGRGRKIRYKDHPQQ
jgi:transcriptional antiterminator RfaH